MVDDDPVALSVLAAFLQQQGHEVLPASSGEVAWRMLKSTEIDFLVSDWIMPDLTGVDLCRRIRAADFDRYVYVILCTAKGEKADLIEGMDAGADDFLIKPIGSEELRVKVRAGQRVLDLQMCLSNKNRDLDRTNRELQSASKLIEEDLNAAAWMQEQLLPPHRHETSGIKYEWRFQPSGYLAGDIFNFFSLDAEHLGFYLLDVSGHGVPAAMLSVTLSMVLSPESTQGSPLKHYDHNTGTFKVSAPGDVIRELNKRFQLKDDRYFTMIYGLFDTRSSILHVAQAGHPGPVLIKKNGDVSVLGIGGMPVGLVPDIEFDCFDVQICQGDRLLLYSDGVTECMSIAGESFGEGGLITYIRQLRMHSLDDMLSEVFTKLRSWHENKMFEDDISLLAIEAIDNGALADTE
jgi:phosphoserine phosphatase RsbU/P